AARASAGGPSGRAAGARVAVCVPTAGAIPGVGPAHRPGPRQGLAKSDLQLLVLSNRRPWAARALLRVLRVGARVSPNSAIKSFKKELSDVDGRAIDELGPGAMAFFVEALRQGPQGVVDEYRIWAQPWGFDLADVKLPVHL